MGAIAGALYSIGYSGADLAILVQQIDWVDLLLPKPILTRDRYEDHKDSLAYPVQFDFSPSQGVFAPELISWGRILNLFNLLK